MAISVDYVQVGQTSGAVSEPDTDGSQVEPDDTDGPDGDGPDGGEGESGLGLAARLRRRWNRVPWRRLKLALVVLL